MIISDRNLTFRFVYIFSLLLSFTAVHTEMDGQHFTKWSIEYARGDQTWLNVDYYYNASIIGISYQQSIDYSGNWRWAYVINPHYVRADYLCNLLSSTTEHAYEIGVGLGIQVIYEMISDKVNMELSVQTGPHYISDTPERQIPGFLFSNQFKVGLEIKFSSMVGIKPFVGFRHMSNGELRLPNGGINNRLYGIALTKTI